MAIVQFEDGTRIEFEGTPTPEDVEFAYKQVKGGLPQPSTTQEPRQWGLFGSVPAEAYARGERNIAGNVFERPAAATRGFIQGMG